MSVGYTIGWTALSSLLGSLKQKFGPAVLLQLHFAYFLPSLPVLYLQQQYHDALVARFGALKSHGIPLTCGLAVASLLCGLHPYFTLSHRYLLFMASLLGLACGSALGSSCQLVSNFSEASQSALTTGFVGSGPIILTLEVAAKMGSQMQQNQRILLYSVVAFFSFLGLLAALLLLRWHQQDLDERRSWRREDRLQSDMEEGIELLDSREFVGLTSSRLGANFHYRTNSPSARDSNPPFREPRSQTRSVLGRQSSTLSSHSSDTTREGIEGAEDVAAKVRPHAMALMSNVACTMIVFPFFTYIPSSGLLPKRLLPQVNFHVRVVADILGRLLPHSWLGLTSSRSMHAMTALKLGITPLIFVYIQSTVIRSDIMAVLYIFLFWFQGGATINAAYILAYKLVRPEQKPKAGSHLALMFQAGSLVGLAVAFLVQRMAEPFRSQWS